MKRLKLVTLYFCAFVFGVNAQTDTVYVSSDNLNVDQLTEGSSSYLVYIEKPDGSLFDIAIWERNVKLRKTPKQELIVIDQRWKNQVSSKERFLLSTNKLKGFTPVYHRTIDGEGKIEAYNFNGLLITGSDTTSSNQKVDFNLELTEPTYNWELDIELLQMLPFEEGKTFMINCYHPGGKKAPQYYGYSVNGKEMLVLPGELEVLCWKLSISYSKSNEAVFWIDSSSNEVLKMIERAGPITRHKVLLY